MTPLRHLGTTAVLAAALVLAGCAAGGDPAPSTAGPESAISTATATAEASATAEVTDAAPATSSPAPDPATAPPKLGTVPIDVTVDGAPVEADFLATGVCEPQMPGETLISAGGEAAGGAPGDDYVTLSVTDSGLLSGGLQLGGVGYFLTSSTTSVAKEGEVFTISAGALTSEGQVVPVTVSADCSA